MPGMTMRRTTPLGRTTPGILAAALLCANAFAAAPTRFDLIGQVTGFSGPIEWDTKKPDGTPQKLLDVSRLSKLGWKAKIPLEEGIRSTYQWWLEHR